MNIVRVSRQLLIIRHRFIPLAACRFKSDKPVDESQSQFDDEKLKKDLDELTKSLDEKLKARPKESEKEIDKDFMNFKRSQEVS